MKKFVLGLFLLIMVVAVSYIKAVRQQEATDKSFQLGVKSSQREYLSARSQVDSLKTRLGEQEVVHAETLLSRDKFVQRNIDSLSKVIQDQSETITSLKVKSTKAAGTQKSSSTETRHRELLAYYKKRYESLPKDLSEYEFKVAVSEIRQETADKYTITVSELNRLRERYQINF